MTNAHSSHEAFFEAMTERLAYFQARPTTEKGALALERFEQALGQMRTLLARRRGEVPEAGMPQAEGPRAPLGAALSVADDE